MKITPPSPSRAPAPFLSLAGIFLLSLHAPLAAQTIPNPSFEQDVFTEFPGYVSAQPEGKTITGWNGFPTTNFGLNPSPDSPFADNGVVPQGTNVAFIQTPKDASPTELSTEITGLTPSTVYRLKFRANVRNGTHVPATPARLSVTLSGLELLNADIFPVVGAAPYHYVSLDFTANNATESLVLRNEQNAVDNTIVVDDFSIAPAPASDPGWSVEQWFDDTSAGADAAYRYTHAYSFGSAAGVVVNDVAFKGIAGIAPLEAGKFFLTGMTNTFNNDASNQISGNSLALSNDFIYGGNPGELNLSGLAPNTPYVLNLYSTGWEQQGKRPVSFSSGDSRFFVDQDLYGQDFGLRIIRNYTSSPDGTATISFRGLGGTFHLYGFSNRETVFQPTAPPEITAAPTGRQAYVNDTVILTGGATGLPVPTYQWLFKGQPIPGEVSPTLTIFVTGGEQAGFYSLRATNPSGTATSAGAYVEVMVPQAGPLYSTGVDDSGFALSAGSEDTHYTLTENAGGAVGTPALVQTGIPVPPWLANDANSQWIGPIVDTAAGAVGRFVYRTTVDAGANPNTFTFSGYWSVDNTGVEIRVNDQVVTGVDPAPGFTGYTWFSVSKANAPALQAGLNNVDFVVENGAPAGFTGLRVFSVKAPEGIEPAVVEAPQNREASPGDTVTFTARAYGTAPITYQWLKDGVPIPQATGPRLTLTSVTPSSVGAYTVTATNPLGTSPASAAGYLRVLTVVPGLGNTGIAADGTPIPDGEPDPRFVLTQNPDGEPNVPATVHTTTIEPIVSSTWLGATDVSKWISSRADSAAAPAGEYIYQTTFSLSGFEAASAVITGSWSSDNVGRAIRVNGMATGLTAPGAFNAYTAFRIDDSNANFVSGVNTLEFVVDNAGAGPTGLRIEGLRVLASGSGVAPTVPNVTITLNGAGRPVLSFLGTPGATYPIQRSISLGVTPTPWTEVGQATANGSGLVTFEDTTAPAGRAFYRAIIIP